jgi:hypothetical protein
MVAASARGGAGLREGGDSVEPTRPLGIATLVRGIVIAIAGAVMATANVLAALDDRTFTVSLGGLLFGLGCGTLLVGLLLHGESKQRGGLTAIAVIVAHLEPPFGRTQA